jgi:hypothetical protein
VPPPVGCPLARALLRWGQRVGFAGALDAGALDRDAQLRAVLVHEGYRGQRLVDRRRAGLAAQQLPTPSGHGRFGADGVGEGVGVVAGMAGQPGDVGGGLAAVGPHGVGGQAAKVGGQGQPGRSGAHHEHLDRIRVAGGVVVGGHARSVRATAGGVGSERGHAVVVCR